MDGVNYNHRTKLGKSVESEIDVNRERTLWAGVKL